MGLSETKLTYKTAKYSFKDQDKYKMFHACNDEFLYSAGISLLVYKSISKNIHQVFRIDGHSVILNFCFKGRRKLCIIQVYLPNNKQLNGDIQKQVLKTIKEERLKNMNIIVMGDFNAVNDSLRDRSKKAAENTKASGRSKEK